MEESSKSAKSKPGRKELTLMVFNYAVFMASIFIVQFLFGTFDPKLGLGFIFLVVFTFTSYQDGKTSSINAFSFLPFVIFWPAYVAGILGAAVLTMFVLAYIVTSRIHLKSLKVKFGDVIAIPAAVSMMAYLGPLPLFTGVASMAAAFYIPMVRKRGKGEVRLLPKAFLGIAAAWVARIIIDLLIPGVFL